MRLDDFMPEYDVRSAHETLVEADVPTTYAALSRTSFADSWVVRTLLRLRSLGRPLPQPTAAPSLLADLERGGFLPLSVEPERELVFGIAGRFWLPRAERVTLRSVEEFDAFSTPGYAKAAWNLSLSGAGTQTRLCTQTRIRCYGRDALIKFRLYWLLVGPFSGVTRMVLLKQVKRSAESARPQVIPT